MIGRDYCLKLTLMVLLSRKAFRSGSEKTSVIFHAQKPVVTLSGMSKKLAPKVSPVERQLPPLGGGA
jgi:hypothetical protein